MSSHNQGNTNKGNQKGGKEQANQGKHDEVKTGSENQQRQGGAQGGQGTGHNAQQGGQGTGKGSGGKS
jgi:hypothetical protein